ncbi:MAG: hypothetical protein HQ463_03035 [Bacteroidetes bacterium]|nr:hypothetical protein [Bacteroidota bacterium]
MQTFLENSIKHGFVYTTKEKPRLIEIKVSNNKKQLFISIKDNGIAIVEQKNKTNQHQSLGINIHKERFLQYQETHQIGVELVLKFKKDNGAEISIMIDI